MTENGSTSNLLVKVLTENLKEQKRTRRWKAVGRLFNLLIMVFVLFALFKGFSSSGELSKYDVLQPHTALIEIKGIIAEDSFYGSADNVIDSLRKAFQQKNVKGIILDLNSPGGSPVQSDLIYNEIKRLQAEDKDGRKVYAVVSDACASGCYYLAAAADEIFANELSTVGSIGVLFSSFGAKDLINKIGIDRRLLTAGKYKALLDPFTEESEDSKKIIQEHLNLVHGIFIDKVKQGRKDRLDTRNPDIFSGLFWTGSQAKTLGLVDDFKTIREVAEEIIKAENIIDYTAKPNFSDVITGNLSKVSMSMGQQLGLLKSLVSLETPELSKDQVLVAR